MLEIDLNNYLLKKDLFEQFKFQLIKDFESSGIGSDFAENLPVQLHQLKEIIETEIKQVEKNQSNLLPILLYRIDISEAQIKKYSKEQPELTYPSLLAELIIKRILQKIILKNTYST